MPQSLLTSAYDVNYIATTGGTLSIPINDTSTLYQVYGTLTLTSSLTINADTSAYPPSNGMTYTFEYTASVILGVNTFTIFGYSLAASQALVPGKITAVWDAIHSVWQTTYEPSFTTKGVGGHGLYETINTIVSFDSLDGGKAIIFLPYQCVLIAAGFSVIETIAGTDDGLISFVDNQTESTLCQLTVPMGSTIPTVGIITDINVTYTPSVLLGTHSHIFVTPYKVTPGGKCAVTLTVQRT